MVTKVQEVTQRSSYLVFEFSNSSTTQNSRHFSLYHTVLRHLITYSCPDLLSLQINSIIMKKKFHPSNLFNYYNNENFKSKVDVSLVR